MPQHGQKLVFGHVLRLGHFPRDRFVFEQALPLGLGFLPGLPFSLQKRTRISQRAVELLDLCNVGAHGDRTLAPA